MLSIIALISEMKPQAIFQETNDNKVCFFIIISYHYEYVKDTDYEPQISNFDFFPWQNDKIVSGLWDNFCRILAEL